MTTDINRLLDNGKCVVLFKNCMGSYTAFAVPYDQANIEEAMNDADEAGHLTNHFTPEEVIKQLADKVMGVGDYS